MSPSEDFFSRGWAVLPRCPDTERWVRAAGPVAAALMDDPGERGRWLRCGGTWFAGVNAFPNGPDGAVPEAGVPPLEGAAMGFVSERLGLGRVALDRAQISACYPGYPQPWEGESEAAFRFRATRDAAHVDGLLRDAERRRSLGETHGFILGLPLWPAHPEAAPLVVWEGSQEIMRAAFRARLAGVASEGWAAEDLTEAYTAARRTAFERCPRVPVLAEPGEAILVHRLALHGVAPWRAPDGPPRAIAYFRPDPYPGGKPDWWLDAA